MLFIYILHFCMHVCPTGLRAYMYPGERHHITRVVYIIR